MIQGHFSVEKPEITPGDQFLSIKNDQDLGLVRLFGIVAVKYARDPSNPLYNLSVAFSGDYRSLIGSNLKKLTK
jgi:hypothetical protein